MSYGIKISKSGYDVLTTADENLVYSSELNNWKIYKSSDTEGEIVFVIPDWDVGYYVDLTHNLGYIPAIEAWCKITDSPDGSNGNFMIPSGFGGNNGSMVIDTYIDSSKIRFYCWSSAPGGDTAIIKYKIYYERLDQ